MYIQRVFEVILACHVDDLVITGPDNDQVDTIIIQISELIKLVEIAKISQTFGIQIEIDFNTKVININQNKYTVTLLK